MKLMQSIQQFHRQESGQDLLEYALVLLAVLTAVVASTVTLADTISNGLTLINGKIVTAIG